RRRAQQSYRPSLHDALPIYFFTLPPGRVSRATYGSNPFPEAIVIASRIAADTRPEDRVAVLGSEPEIFFYSHRRSATGHVYMYRSAEDTSELQSPDHLLCSL